MNYEISKIKIHNFKLFGDAEIDFQHKKLVVLDGPNGYGKTSTFDAIEYLLTGNILRVADSKISTGNISFENDCIMKSPSDGTGTYIEGILRQVTGEEIRITRYLEKGENNKDNKPNQISARTKTDIEFQGKKESFEIGKVDEANKWIQDKIGEHVVPFYNRFYYISQEDRLAFLKNSDTERMNELKKLFGIEKEEEMLKKLATAKSSFKNMLETLEKSIKDNEKKLEKIIIPEEGEKKESCEYKKILDESITTIIWDKKDFSILDKDQLIELEEDIKKTGYFTRDFTSFQKDLRNEWIKTQVENQQQLGKFLFLENYQADLSTLKSEKSVYNEIKKTAKSVENKSIDYEKINYEEVSENLKLDINLQEIRDIKNEIEKCRKNVKKDDEIRAELKKMQDGMEEARRKWLLQKIEGLNEEQCPFCGSIWKSKADLETAIEALKDVIEKGRGEEQKKLDGELEKLRSKFTETYLQPILDYQNSHTYLDSDICNDIYDRWNIVMTEYKVFRNACDKYDIKLTDWQLPKDDLEEWDTRIFEFVETVLKKKLVELDDEYLVRKNQYGYSKIYKNIYSEDDKKVGVLTEHVVNEKISYLEQQFYLNQGKLLSDIKEEISKIKGKKGQAEKIYFITKNLEKRLKNELNDFNKRLVEDMRLSFFLYTGRILQNYPGGLGIKMQMSGESKIRFEAPNRKEHDVFYTLSSGQLSAVAIALALTLNKIYAPKSFRCIMIDDPIQTMDELNISSFVEMLRNDFSEYQFIISTHEDNFSDYIRYKYEKYGLSNKYISVQELENEESRELQQP